MRIIISGGSIAGCAAGILLGRLPSSNITILEQSTRALNGRGAGIVLPDNFIKQCIELDLFDHNIPRLPIKARSFYVRDKRQIWHQHAFAVSTLNWSDVYQNLRKRISNYRYHAGEAVSKVCKIDENCEIETTSGKKYTADMLIAADGYNSTIRKQVFPNLLPIYSGYVAWRGVTNVPSWIEEKHFTEHVPYYVFPNGHLLLYCIPETGGKRLNWLMYENREQSISLPPGGLSIEHIQHLREISTKFLPKEIANIITQTEKPFVQAIVDLQVPHYVNNSICFIGDAASTTRPHSASGIFKAINDSIKLAEALQKSEFDKWSESQLTVANQQTLLASNMGKALVTHTPDWDQMNQTLMDEWWGAVMSGQSWYATTAPTVRP